MGDQVTTHRGPGALGTTGLPGTPRFEVLPLPGITGTVLESLPRHATVTVTASPRRGPGATIATAVSLAAQGVSVVPHLSARQIRDEAALKTTLDTLTTAGITEIFVIGGDPVEPVGEFTGAMDILPTIAQADAGLRVGIAGYPEPHPVIADDTLIQSMRDKLPFASYVVSQMCFDAGTLRTWVRRIRDRGVALPVLVGVPGPTSPSTLLRVGTKVGVGESVRVLRKHRGGLRHLAAPTPWRPDRLLRDLAPAFADPDSGLEGMHVYTFNDVAAAGRWWQETASGDRDAAPTADQ